MKPQEQCNSAWPETKSNKGTSSQSEYGVESQYGPAELTSALNFLFMVHTMVARTAIKHVLLHC